MHWQKRCERRLGISFEHSAATAGRMQPCRSRYWPVSSTRAQPGGACNGPRREASEHAPRGREAPRSAASDTVPRRQRPATVAATSSAATPRSETARKFAGSSAAFSPRRPAVRAASCSVIEEIDVIVGQFIDFARGAECETPIRGDLNALATQHATDDTGLAHCCDLHQDALPNLPADRSPVSAS